MDSLVDLSLPVCLRCLWTVEQRVSFFFFFRKIYSSLTGMQFKCHFQISSFNASPL